MNPDASERFEAAGPSFESCPAGDGGIGEGGRVLRSFHPEGRCYGYRNVPIEDPTRQGKYGRPAVSGVRLEIIREEAAVVRRILMSAVGTGLAGIGRSVRYEKRSGRSPHCTADEFAPGSACLPAGGTLRNQSWTPSSKKIRRGQASTAGKNYGERQVSGVCERYHF